MRWIFLTCFISASLLLCVYDAGSYVKKINQWALISLSALSVVILVLMLHRDLILHSQSICILESRPLTCGAWSIHTKVESASSCRTQRSLRVWIMMPSSSTASVQRCKNLLLLLAASIHLITHQYLHFPHTALYCIINNLAFQICLKSTIQIKIYWIWNGQ